MQAPLIWYSLVILLFCIASIQGSPPTQAFPIYGHWCGLGHSGPHEPIDELDTICMNHDKCYEKHGMHAQKCDLKMLAELTELQQSQNLLAPQKALVELFIIVFTLKPADPGYREALQIILESSKKINDIQKEKKFKELNAVAKGRILIEISSAAMQLIELDLPNGVAIEIEKLKKILSLGVAAKNFVTNKKDEI